MRSLNGNGRVDQTVGEHQPDDRQPEIDHIAEERHGMGQHHGARQIDRYPVNAAEYEDHRPIERGAFVPAADPHDEQQQRQQDLPEHDQLGKPDGAQIMPFETAAQQFLGRDIDIAQKADQLAAGLHENFQRIAARHQRRRGDRRKERHALIGNQVTAKKSAGGKLHVVDTDLDLAGIVGNVDRPAPALRRKLEYRSVVPRLLRPFRKRPPIVGKVYLAASGALPEFHRFQRGDPFW